MNYWKPPHSRTHISDDSLDDNSSSSLIDQCVLNCFKGNFKLYYMPKIAHITSIPEYPMPCRCISFSFVLIITLFLTRNEEEQ